MSRYERLAMSPIERLVILGGGTAGLLAALSFRRALPSLHVRLVASSEIGVIGVGEGTTPIFPEHLFGFLGLDPDLFYQDAQPTWKLGIRFKRWGPRDSFYYPFSPQFDMRTRVFPQPHGYYARLDHQPANLAAALMDRGSAFPRRADGTPEIHSWHSFHIENVRLVRYLTARCREAGVEFTDGTVERVETRGDQVATLTLTSGDKVTADLFIDTSGFRSELLGRALSEPVIDYSGSLFCDRAMIAGWERTDEPILPYTTAETMDASWCWQIEHEHFINRGYVFSSRHLSDDEARSEFLRKNPRITAEPRIVNFSSGRRGRSWVGNVVGIGNSAGFVEPLEATAISLLIFSVRILIDVLRECERTPNATLIEFFNRQNADVWDETRDFLALHYKYNTRLATPFWQMARSETTLGELADFARFWEENGPSLTGRHFLRNPANIFGLEGHLALLIGMDAPCNPPISPKPAEMDTWRRACSMLAEHARNSLSVRDCLDAVRRPDWQWPPTKSSRSAISGLSYVVR